MRILLLLFICLMTTNLFGQKEKHIFTGIKAGTEIGLLGLESSDLEANTNLGVGYSVTVDFIEYRFRNNFSLNLGLGFTNRKYRQRIENVSLTNNFSKALVREYLLVRNVEVPITTKYFLNKKNNAKAQFYFIGGATVYYNLHHDSQQELLFSDGTTWEYNNQKNIKRTTLAATLGTGLQFKMEKDFEWFVETICQVNPNYINFQYGSNARTLMSLGLMTGIRFGSI